MRSKIEKCEFFRKGGFFNLNQLHKVPVIFSFLQGPGLSMVGVLDAPKFGYVPELIKN